MSRTGFKKRGIGAFVGLLLAAGALTPVLATPASATGTSGFIEICKTFQQAPITVNQSAGFDFTISGYDGGTVTVPAGTCSPAIWVSGGAHTVTEASQPWYSATQIAADPGFPALVDSSLTDQSATVNVDGAVNGGVSEVRFTNVLDPGWVEVCKAAYSGSGLSGSYSFNITGADGFSTTATAPVGYCSDPIEVPAGTVTTTEAGTNLYVTSLSAQINGTGANALLDSNLTSGTADVTVLPSNDASTQTDVNYTNDVVNFKVCKKWSDANGQETQLPGGVTTSFPFTETASGPAGPNTAPAPFSLQAGQCSNPTAYRAGTIVTVTEGIVPGSKVKWIDSDLGGSVVPGSLSLTGRTVQVIVGTPVTASNPPLNENIVTFKNEYADPGTLKICKVAGTPAPLGTNFTFTVTGGATGTGIIPLGACGFLLDSNGNIQEIPYNSTVTITEGASTGNATSAISWFPTNVNVNVGGDLWNAGTPTNTGETTLANGPSLGGTGTTSSIGVVIGEGTVTEVAFTDIDPPTTPVLPAPGSPVITPVVAPVSGSGTSTGPALSSPASSDVAVPTGGMTAVLQLPSVNTSAAAVGATVSSGILNTINTSAVTKSLKQTPAQVRALLRHDLKLHANVMKMMKRWTKAVHHTKGRSHLVAVRHLVALRAELRVLNIRIALLKK